VQMVQLTGSDQTFDRIQAETGVAPVSAARLAPASQQELHSHQVNLADHNVPDPMQFLRYVDSLEPAPSLIKDLLIDLPFEQERVSERGDLRRLAEDLSSNPTVAVDRLELDHIPGELRNFSITAEVPEEPTGLNLKSFRTPEVRDLGEPTNFQFPRVDREQSLAA